jgi:hypothetical protein
MKYLVIILALSALTVAAGDTSSIKNKKPVNLAMSFIHYLQHYSTNIDSLSHRFKKQIVFRECHDEDTGSGYKFIDNRKIMNVENIETQNVIKQLMRYRAGELFIFSSDSIRIDFWSCSQASISNQPLKITESEGPGNIDVQEYYSIDSSLSYGTDNAFGLVCRKERNRFIVIQIEQSSSP